MKNVYMEEKSWEQFETKCEPKHELFKHFYLPLIKLLHPYWKCVDTLYEKNK